MVLLIGSANHERRVFARPDRLDVERAHDPHLSLGAGVHYCLGAPLARLESSLALGRLLTRARNMEPAPSAVGHKDITATIRGVKALPVTLTAA
ncbi:cytochrome P450 [Streptomyces sp. NPDC032940]|uniref:cytochrome P450 n=1 Tax=Streptomyces sp. NPDC032940 TaxID=3155366 RepID=UPI003411963C